MRIFSKFCFCISVRSRFLRIFSLIFLHNSFFISIFAFLIRVYNAQLISNSSLNFSFALQSIISSANCSKTALLKSSFLSKSSILPSDTGLLLFNLTFISLLIFFKLWIYVLWFIFSLPSSEVIIQLRTWFFISPTAFFIFSSISDFIFSHTSLQDLSSSQSVSTSKSSHFIQLITWSVLEILLSNSFPIAS